MMDTAWTENEDAQLQEMRDAKLKTKVIAGRLGRSPKAVTARARRLGLTLDVAWKAEEDVFFDLGWTNTAIANEIGRTVKAVAYRRRNRPKEAPPQGDAAYVTALWAQGGFFRLSERDLGQGRFAVCLPLLRAA